MKFFLYLLLVSTSLTSCVVNHSGLLSSSSIGKPFQYKDIAVGVSQTSQFLFLGGTSQDGLVLEAKKELMRNYPVQINEEYLNFTVDYKRIYYPLLSKVKVTVTADVITLKSDTIFEKYSETYKNKIMRDSPGKDLFLVGDTVLYGPNKKGILVSFYKNSRVRVLSTNSKNYTRIKSFNVENIYVIKESYRGINAKERYVYQINFNGGTTRTSGKVVAFGLNDFLLREANGNIKAKKYSD